MHRPTARFHMFPLLACMLLRGCSAQSAALLSVDKNLELPIACSFSEGALLTYINLLFCIDPSNKIRGQFQQMVINLTHPFVVVGSQSQADQKFGISCTAQNSCAADGVYRPCAFNPEYQCTDGHTLLRFKEMSLPSNFSTDGLPFQLMLESQSWVEQYGNVGILGLGRSSPFWGYLISQYRRSDDDTFSISLLYRLKDSSVILKPEQIELENSFFTVNGRAGENHLFIVKPLASAASNWIVPAANLTVFGNLTYLNKPLCIDDSSNYFLLFEDSLYQSLLRQFNTQLCGQESACTRNNSDQTNCSGLTVSYFDGGSTLDIEIFASELVSFDASGTAIYGFSSMGSSECAKDDAQFALGRWFLTKIELTIRVNSKLEFSLGLSALSSSSKSTSILVLILITIGALVLIGGSIVLCINFLPNACKKRDQADAEDAHTPLKSAVQS